MSIPTPRRVSRLAPMTTRLPLADTEGLVDHLAEAEPRTLLMSLVHLTHDAELLRRFAPLCDTEASPETTGQPAQEVRRLLTDVLTGAAPHAPADEPLPTGLFREMAATYLDQPVDEEFVPLLLEQCGFSLLEGVDPAHRPTPPADFAVAIIGGGLSGICAGIKLGEAGYRYRVYDKNPEVGGTWLTNRYPGVGVDTPSHFYSYSFEINPDWPEYYSGGSVVQDYLRRCADAYGVRENVAYKTEVIACAWHEDRQQWKITSRTGDGATSEDWASAVISAIGFFQDPMTPDIPGLEKFAGTTVHTAAWDHDVDLTGKKVAMVGTGAGAMQLGPAIVDDVAEMTVFQRQPPWVLPRREASLTVPAGARWAMRHLPFYAEWFRVLTYWFAADGNYALVVTDPEWTMPEVSVSQRNENMRQWLLAYAREELAARPDLLEKVIPQYPPFGKRILRDSNWYALLKRDHVDLETSPIDHVTAQGPVTRDGRLVEADVLILATGYHLLPLLEKIHVTGRDGIALADLWGREDPRAHLGLTVPGFPNLFVMAGPNSAPNHGAGVNIVAEAQIAYIISSLGHMHAHDASSIEPTPAAHAAYSTTVDRALDGLVWSHPSVRSYYRNSSGRVVVSCPWRLVDYWHMLRGPVAKDHVLR